MIVHIVKNGTTDERTINTFGHHYLYSAGVATTDPGEAPPLAGFNMKSQVAYITLVRLFLSAPLSKNQ